MIDLVHVHKEPEATKFLYALLRERSSEDDKYVNISHRALPPFDEHERFVRSRPYRYWYLIRSEGEWVGYISCTKLNEIGIVLMRAHRRRGYGKQALARFVAEHKPLPAIPARRSGRFLANINPANAPSIALFHGAGFTHLQNTYAL